MKLELDGTSIEEAIVNKTATIGEKLSFRRFELVEKLIIKYLVLILIWAVRLLL